MQNQNNSKNTINSLLFGRIVAISITVITIITFGLAIIAVPISGANCIRNCVEYPYVNTAAQFPHDFFWMPAAMILTFDYLLFFITIHANASDDHKIYSQVGLSLAIISTTIIILDYYIQFSVIPSSLLNGETEGLALFIQYNPHGIFIAMEELGYIIMSLSFLAVAPVFTNITRKENIVHWINIISPISVIMSFIIIYSKFGTDRQDSFEIIAISINWLVFIIEGILINRIYTQRLHEITPSP
jgi:hypothetical protein